MSWKIDKKDYGNGEIYRRMVGEAVANIVGQRHEITQDESEDIAGLIETGFKPREVIDSLNLNTRQRKTSKSA